MRKLITFILMSAAGLTILCYAVAYVVAYKVYRDLTRGIRRKRVRTRYG